MNTESDSIGTAQMSADGTISLQLRAEEGEMVGDSFFEYKPDSPEYAEILDHIGGLKPGEEKSVSPWLEDE